MRTAHSTQDRRQTGATLLLSWGLKVCDVTVNHHVTPCCALPPLNMCGGAGNKTATQEDTTPRGGGRAQEQEEGHDTTGSSNSSTHLRVVHDSLSVRAPVWHKWPHQISSVHPACVRSIPASPHSLTHSPTHSPSLSVRVALQAPRYNTLASLEPVARMGHATATLPGNAAPHIARLTHITHHTHHSLSYDTGGQHQHQVSVRVHSHGASVLIVLQRAPQHQHQH